MGLQRQRNRPKPARITLGMSTFGYYWREMTEGDRAGCGGNGYFLFIYFLDKKPPKHTEGAVFHLLSS